METQLAKRQLTTGLMSYRMKDAHTDIVIVASGITAPLWVNALTDWFGFFAAAAAMIVGAYRVYQIFWGPKRDS